MASSLHEHPPQAITLEVAPTFLKPHNCSEAALRALIPGDRFSISATEDTMTEATMVARLKTGSAAHAASKPSGAVGSG